MAMAKLEQEFKPAEPLAVDPSDHSAGAEALRRVVADPARAARSLSGFPGWRKAPGELAAAVLNDAPADGFLVSAAALSPAEWQALHAELLKLVPQ